MFFALTAHSIQPSDNLVAALKSYKSPTNMKVVRVFLGLVNFLRNTFPTEPFCIKPHKDLAHKGASFTWLSQY